MEFLPADITRIILSYIPYVNLGNVFRTCKQFNKFSTNYYFWSLRNQLEFTQELSNVGNFRHNYLNTAKSHGIAYPGTEVHAYQHLMFAIITNMKNTTYYDVLLEKIEHIKYYHYIRLVEKCFKYKQIDLAVKVIKKFLHTTSSDKVAEYCCRYQVDLDTTKIRNSCRVYEQGKLIYEIKTGLKVDSKILFGLCSQNPKFLKYFYLYKYPPEISIPEEIKAKYEIIEAINKNLPNLQLPDICSYDVWKAIIKHDRIDLLTDSVINNVNIFSLLLECTSKNKTILLHLLSIYKDRDDDDDETPAIIESAIVTDIKKFNILLPYIKDKYEFQLPIIIFKVFNPKWHLQYKIHVPNVTLFKYTTVENIIYAIQFHGIICLIKTYEDLESFDIDGQGYLKIRSKYTMKFRRGTLYLTDRKLKREYRTNVKGLLQTLLDQNFFGVYVDYSEFKHWKEELLLLEK